MSTIVCSHGFGVRADARGMFTELAAAFPNHTFITFDYNQVTDGGDLITAPLDVQAKLLQSKLDGQDDVILLAHSQGCIITGMVDLTHVRSVILLAPPVVMSMQHVIDKLSKRPGAEINPNGNSKLPRTDGTSTLISQDYLKSINDIDPPSLYRKVAVTRPTIIVRATEDKVLGLTNVNEVNEARLIDLESDHDFQGDARQLLIETLRPLL